MGTAHSTASPSERARRAAWRTLAVGLALWPAALRPAPAAEPVPAPAAAPQAARPAFETLPGGKARVGAIQADPDTRSLRFPAVMNLGEGVLEVIIATPRGRLHEALLKAEADISPLALQALLYALNLNNGPRMTDATGRRGDLVDIDLEYTAAVGRTVREPVEAWIRDTRTGKPKTRTGWVFVGSVVREGTFLAEEEGNICINYSAGSTILDNPDPDATDDTIHVVESERQGPRPGEPVTVIITARQAVP